MGPMAYGASPRGGAMKWLFMAGYAGLYLFYIVGLALTSAGSDTAAVGSVVVGLGVLCWPMALVAGMVWLYQAWASVPDQMRYSDAGKWITPGQAVGYLFIPFFNLYWVFIANLGLCEAINRTLVAQGKPPRAPKGLAIATCVTQVIPYCNFLVAPILWTVYMFMMDTARKEMLATNG
jgi:hypothetical protein